MQDTRSLQTVVPTSIPSALYRVDYPGSQTSFSPTEGFRARNMHTIIANVQQLHFYASAHFNWASNISSPFISVFADRTRAEHWACGFSEGDGGKECYVVAISTAALGRGPIFRAADLIGAGVQSPIVASQHWSEYLVLYRVPVAALINEIVISAGPQLQNGEIDSQMLLH
ncbi:hypothetical protein AOQ84DRAFT_227877 [Glonium stellatum]|uniref:DUF7587 domain-containing protein n=1 Tax=Glonium stellatum TaxID=574774 RepID=A0A8E2ERS3_9PEZI|nr:hypothetical protein AOQ84DRAFT_227877 [Glonium stellatum]